MITEESNRKITPRSTMKVGDLAIIHALFQGKIWHVFFNEHWSKFVGLVLKGYLRFTRAMLAFQLWSVFRYTPGYQSVGILLFLSSLSFLMGYNSIHVPELLKPFAFLIVPLVPFFSTPEELYQLVFVDVESKSMLVYSGIFTLSALAHLVTIWMGGNPSITKRGESWIALGLSKFMKVNEYVICGLLEPLIVTGIGLVVWKLGDDLHFAVFLFLIAFSEAVQQLLDKALQAEKDSMLKS
ncbi:MAG: hypothetical protein RLN81_03095 [Balneolaceae bacterium]